MVMALAPRLCPRARIVAFMLGVLPEIASAVAAAAGDGGAEDAVAAVAGLERVPYIRRWGRRPVWGQGRQLSGEAVGQEGCRAVQGLCGEVGGQGVSYGGGCEVPFQPGGDSRGQVFRVGGREEQAGVVAAQACEEVGGLLEEGRGRVARLRYGREEPLAGRLPFLRRSGGLVFAGPAAMTRPVAGDRAGDDTAAGDAFAGAAEVAMGLQVPQGRGDTVPALGEAGREGLDVHGSACGEGLEVEGQPSGDERELGVLGEVVPDHREAFGVAGVVVDQATHAGVVFARGTGLGARGRARVLRVHQEGPASLVVRPSHWDASPGEGRCMSAVVLRRL
jgi:hypothetical protein